MELLKHKFRPIVDQIILKIKETRDHKEKGTTMIDD